MKTYEIEGSVIKCTESNEFEIEQKNDPIPLVEKRKCYRKLTKVGVLTGCAVLILSVAFLSVDVGKSDDISPIIEQPTVIIEQTAEASEVVNEDVTIEVVDAVIPTEPDISELYQDEIKYIAKTVYGEARGNTKTEQAAVIWTILNRVDSDLKYMPDDIISVVTQNYQYIGYNPNHPVTDDITDLVEDVLTRWIMEKDGETNVGRVLPKDYLWFYGDGKHNYFTNEWRSGNNWDWSLESPY